MRYILLFSLFVAAYLQSYSQTYRDKYDLNFNLPDECRSGWGWMVYSFATNKVIDGEETIEGKHPVKIFYQDWLNKKPTDNMSFVLCKVIPLFQYEKGNKCTVSLNSKSAGQSNAFFVVTGYDESETITFVDSVSLRNTDWLNNSLTFKLTSEKAIRININYYGNNDPAQAVWLDKASIKINDNDIANYNIHALDKKTKAELNSSIDKKYIIPLFNDSNSLLPVLEIVKGKKIIGLGECTHGSLAIKESIYQFVKILIENGNVKLLMVERPIDMFLKYDLFIQGYTGEEYITQIKEDEKYYLDDYESLSKLLIWLRKYNSTTKSKIHICGFDGTPIPHVIQRALTEYHQVLLGEKAAIPYLKLIDEMKYKELAELANSDVIIQNKLGEKCFKLYNYVLEDCVSLLNSAMTKKYARDIEMVERIQKTMEIFLERDENVVLHAHSGHLRRVAMVEDYPYTEIMAGHLLSKKYREAYFPISFQIGEGEYTDDKCSGFLGGRVPTSLPLPMPQSFESVAINTRFDYFYYPSKYLVSNILLANSISRGSHYNKKDKFLSLPKHFDAYVFIRYSTPLRKIKSD